MALGSGGRLYLEFLVPTDEDDSEPVLRPISPELVRSEMAEHGGEVLEETLSPFVAPALALQNEAIPREVCRMIIGWGTK